VLEETERQGVTEPCVLVIFGATGDLTSRKLLPALHALCARGLLPERFAIVGVARQGLSTEKWCQRMHEAVRLYGHTDVSDDGWTAFAKRMHYIDFEFADEHGYRRLMQLLHGIDDALDAGGNTVHYLAAPPSAYPAIVQELGEHRGPRGWTRLVIEKPFGYNLASAVELNTLLHRYFNERELFRIDHYLGKETVQNLLVLRFANGIFEPLWNRQLVDQIQITVAETIGIEGRAEYYERAGALRDVLQNHLLQLVALSAMEPPIDFGADQLRNEKVKVLRSLHTPAPRDVALGQYGRGVVDGVEVRAYREEPGVAPDSNTETYAAVKLHVDNWRWAGTPFYLRTGKRLAERTTIMVVQFKPAPHPPFRNIRAEQLPPNALLLRLQPDEAISVGIAVKVPGQGMSIRPVRMDFPYGGAFRSGLPDGYERLIVDALTGDQTLFMRADEIEEQWALVDAIAAGVRRDLPGFPNYHAGTWGPAAADELLRRDGRVWLDG
jgi:glucose-6-phosphate 1-dehydrogenase